LTSDIFIQIYSHFSIENLVFVKFYPIWINYIEKNSKNSNDNVIMSRDFALKMLSILVIVSNFVGTFYIAMVHGKQRNGTLNKVT